MLLLTRCYFVALLGWAVLRLLFGDRWTWLFTANAFAPFLFLPLPVFALVVLLARRRDLLIALLLGCGLFAYLWGALFVPDLKHDTPEGPTLRVMTYNMLGVNQLSRSLVAAIRAGDADVVGLIELSPENAAAIAKALIEEYPYQALSPLYGNSGMGLISRLPMNALGETLSNPSWNGQPQCAEIELEGRTVTVLIFHTASYPAPASVRDHQADLLADFAREHDGPLVVMGDLNSTSTNLAYGTVASALADSWREVGHGFGGTFPSHKEERGFEVPRWLVRIDYVFHSKHWRAVGARTGNDGGSDHRPVIVDLVLTR